MTIDETTTYQVVSIDGERVTTKASIVQSAANQKVENPAMPGLKLDVTKMSGTGGGDITFQLNQVMPAKVNLNAQSQMDMSLNMGGQKQSMTMKRDQNVRIESK
jgi:hypothetical protein